jgi:hypothetical protein
MAARGAAVRKQLDLPVPNVSQTATNIAQAPDAES